MSLGKYLVRVNAPDINPLFISIRFRRDFIIKNLVAELWKRLARLEEYLHLSPDTYSIVLHLDNATGPIIDIEDVFSNVIQNRVKPNIWAVLIRKSDAPAAPEPGLRVRVVQASDSMNRQFCHVLNVSPTDTFAELHDRIARSLDLQDSSDRFESDECNCILSRQVAEGPSEPGSFVVIHSKSIVERVCLPTATTRALKRALAKFIPHNESSPTFDLGDKEVTMFGGITSNKDNKLYNKIPVVSICSKQRHVPIQARTDPVYPSQDLTSHCLDLHTSEQPVRFTCYARTIKDLGLTTLAVDGIVNIFAVPRATQGIAPSINSKSTIYAHQIHWEPPVAQSDRGMAIFLSVLRVFTSIIQDLYGDDKSMFEAVFRIFDQLTHFAPALRCIAILAKGGTPSAAECAALGHAVFTALDSHFPALKIFIQEDRSRLFEGSRLFFAFILESARSMKSLLETELIGYVDAFTWVDMRDCMTTEAIYCPIQTSEGLVEQSLFSAFQRGGVLADSHLQSFKTQSALDPNLARYAKLSGGISPEVMILSVAKLPHHAELPLDMDQLGDLAHIADLCGRNKLAVHKPSHLASAVAPCLTFDRKAHLAVYTGEQPCGAPGLSSLVFRPQHGEETIDPTLIEQIISPLLDAYVANGTAVFDSLGGAELKKMQEPTEVLVFCVDSSTSMGHNADFADVDGDDLSDDDEPTPTIAVHSLVDSQPPRPLDEARTMLLRYEGYHEMIAIIAAAPLLRKFDVTDLVWSIYQTMLASDIIRKAEKLEEGQQSGYYGRDRIRQLTGDLQNLKTMYSSIHLHEDQLKDLLRSNAAGLPQGPQKWTWSFGEVIPSESSFEVMPPLSPDITDVPHRLKCPVGHVLMQQAVKAADGFTYDRASIEKYFAMNTRSPVSSPMYRSNLPNRKLTNEWSVRQQVEQWISGAGLPGSYSKVTSEFIGVTFRSRAGSFPRMILCSASLKDVYKIAFRALAAQFDMFQLMKDNIVIQPSDSVTVSSSGCFQDGDDIHIRIPEETRAFRTISSTGSTTARQTSPSMYLVKVFDNVQRQKFAFWVRNDTSMSMATVIWKYWRFSIQHETVAIADARELECWTDMSGQGDGCSWGFPRLHNEAVATYLTSNHCTGQLGPEKLYDMSEDPSRGEDDAAWDSGHTGNVLKLWIRSPKSKRQTRRNKERFSRLDVLKQMFEALINRLVAYGYRTHVGLVSFASQAQIQIPITHVLENFRRATTELEAAGDTALWDALNLASDHLREYASSYPNAKKRIICISDGEDTKSTVHPSYLWVSLQSHDIAVDSICLGGEENAELRTLSYLLGCYRFQPATLENAMSICEMEPFLALAQRPDITRPKPARSRSSLVIGRFRNSLHRAGHTLVTSDTIPPMKEHPNLRDDFVELSALATQSRSRPLGFMDYNISGSGRLRTYRLMTEMKAIAAAAHPYRDVYVSTADMSFWKVVIQGPEGSPYSEGRFLLYLHADENFPAFAPKARFVTQIKHPNVNPHGRICHSIFDRDWTSDTSITSILNTVYALLYQPEHNDRVNTSITLEFHRDQLNFTEQVREHVRKHASRTREQWRAQILGEVPETED